MGALPGPGTASAMGPPVGFDGQRRLDGEAGGVGAGAGGQGPAERGQALMESAQSLSGPGVRLPAGRGPVIDHGDAQQSRLPTEEHAGACGAGVAGGIGQSLGHDPGSGLHHRGGEEFGCRRAPDGGRFCMCPDIRVELDGDAGSPGPVDRFMETLGEAVGNAGLRRRCALR